MQRQLFPAAVLIVFSFLTVACGGAHKVKMTTAEAVPAARGIVEVGKDRNGNTTIDLRVQHLAQPSALTPPADAYVVWVQPRGKPPQNVGQLTVNNDLSAEFKTATPYKDFDLFVTAEGNPRASSPTGQEIMRQHISR